MTVKETFLKIKPPCIERKTQRNKFVCCSSLSKSFLAVKEQFYVHRTEGTGLHIFSLKVFNGLVVPICAT